MSKPARTLFAFGIYVVVVGIALVVAPAIVTTLLKLPPATVGWARVVGLLALVIGTYDIVGARAESLPYIRASVLVRVCFAAGCAALVACGQMPMSLLLLGFIDLAAAVWTALALRKASHDGRSAGVAEAAD
jgi:hypothetical protein